MDSSFWWGPSFNFSWVFPILCLIFVAAMMVMMFRRGGACCMPMHRRRADSGDNARETPRQILDRRLASGEIAQEQYDAIGRGIESNQNPS